MRVHFIKVIKAIVISSIFIGVVAFSNHKNPLEEMDPHQASFFLLRASHYAERSMNLDLNYAGFRDCIEKKINKNFCDYFYAYMLEFAKVDKQPPNLTYRDLTDVVVWQKLKEKYNEFVTFIETKKSLSMRNK